MEPVPTVLGMLFSTTRDKGHDQARWLLTLLSCKHGTQHLQPIVESRRNDRQKSRLDSFISFGSSSIPILFLSLYSHKKKKDGAERLALVGGLRSVDHLFVHFCGNRRFISLRRRSPVVHRRVPYGQPTNEHLPRGAFSAFLLYFSNYHNG